MSNLAEVRDAIVATLQAEWADEAEEKTATAKSRMADNVSAHSGAFTPDELKMAAAKGPHVFVACTGMRELGTWGGHEVWGEAEFATWVVTRGVAKPTLSRTDKHHREVLLLASAIGRVLGMNKKHRWPAGGTGTDYTAHKNPEAVTGRNRQSVELTKIGVAVWEWRWRQRVELTSFSSSDLDDLDTIFSQFQGDALEDLPDDEHSVLIDLT